MSYLDKLSKQERAKLAIVNVSIRDFYKDAKEHFSAQNPDQDFSKGILTIENKIFANDCSMVDEFDCSIEFKNCYFLNDVLFYDCKLHKRLAISHSFCEKGMRITKSAVFLDDFDLILLCLNDMLYVDGGQFAQCRWSIMDNGTVRVNGGKYEQLNIGYWGGVELRELSFHFPNITGMIKVTNEKSKIVRLDLFQFSPDLSMAIEDINVNLISIYRFRNEKSFRIFNIKSFETEFPSEFAISESYLGKTEFYSVDFSSFKNVFISDVHLTDCAFVNIKWKYEIDSFKGRAVGKSKEEEEIPKKIAKLRNELNENYFDIDILKNDPAVLSYFSKNRETYRQLKFALGKQGDVINEQKFHSKEMVAYNRSIKFETEPWTKLIIKLSQWFSDFGQSFTRPLLALFIGHWFWLILLILSGNFKDLSINLSNPNWEGFKIAFENYFRLINPLRRAEFTFEGYRIVIDLIMRIWSSYMLYNIIRATRRFIK